MLRKHYLPTLLLGALLAGCGDGAWNNPNPPKLPGKNTYYSVITRVPPKHLDPAISYASDESLFIDQIYQPPLGYHFLKRPYELIPLGLESLPEVEYLDASGQSVPRDSDAIAFTRYILTLRDDLRYQPHPALAVDAGGEPRYLFSSSADEENRYLGSPRASTASAGCGW